MSKKFKTPLNLTLIMGTLHEAIYTVWQYLSEFFRIRNASENIGRGKTHILCELFFIPKVMSFMKSVGK